MAEDRIIVGLVAFLAIWLFVALPLISSCRFCDLSYEDALCKPRLFGMQVFHFPSKFIDIEGAISNRVLGSF